MRFAVGFSRLAQVTNSDWIGETYDAKIGLTGKPMKAEYKRLTLEQEQACDGQRAETRTATT